jgi:hypothetical protein
LTKISPHSKTPQNNLSDLFAFFEEGNPTGHTALLCDLSVDLYSTILIIVAKGTGITTFKIFGTEMAELEITCEFPFLRTRNPGSLLFLERELTQYVSQDYS